MDERKATVYTCVAFYIVVLLNHNTIINLMVNEHDNHGYRGKTMKKPWFLRWLSWLTMV